METQESGLQEGAVPGTHADLSGAPVEAGDPAGDLADDTAQAERAVMHPDWHDPEWRYYCGAWHS